MQAPANRGWIVPFPVHEVAFTTVNEGGGLQRAPLNQREASPGLPGPTSGARFLREPTLNLSCTTALAPLPLAESIASRQERAGFRARRLHGTSTRYRVDEQHPSEFPTTLVALSGVLEWWLLSLYEPIPNRALATASPRVREHPIHAGGAQRNF